MAKIRIIAIPPGFALEPIRSQWVGVEISLPTEEQVEEDPPSGFGIGDQNQDGYLVLTSDAIRSLENAEKHSAAAFWQSMGIGKYLRFSKDVCEEIV